MGAYGAGKAVGPRRGRLGGFLWSLQWALRGAVGSVGALCGIGGLYGVRMGSVGSLWALWGCGGLYGLYVGPVGSMGSLWGLWGCVGPYGLSGLYWVSMGFPWGFVGFCVGLGIPVGSLWALWALWGVYGVYGVPMGSMGSLWGPGPTADPPPDFLFKFLVIGSAGTGKSCLLHHFIESKCEQFIN